MYAARTGTYTNQPGNGETDALQYQVIFRCMSYRQFVLPVNRKGGFRFQLQMLINICRSSNWISNTVLPKKIPAFLNYTQLMNIKRHVKRIGFRQLLDESILNDDFTKHRQNYCLAISTPFMLFELNVDHVCTYLQVSSCPRKQKSTHQKLLISKP